MSYSIGDVSRVLGMTTSALHYYEKEGIIDTPKEGSGRRYYEAADVYRLISAKKYRTMGVSLREIAEHFAQDGMTGEQVIARMREKQDEAQRLSVQYAGLAGDIGRLIALGEEGLASSGAVDIRPAEDMLILKLDRGGFVPEKRAQQELVRQWLEAMPAVSVGIVGAKEETSASFSLMVPARRASDYGFSADGEHVQLIKGGMALHAVVHCGEEQYKHPECIFQSILSFAQEHRFKPAGVLYGSTLFVDCSGGVRKHFYDTYMVFA